MEFDQTKAKIWLKFASSTLTGLPDVLKLTTSEVVIIGAGVFDIYHTQDWIPPFTRKTGDLDMSVGLVSGEQDYHVLKDDLLQRGYLQKGPPYRFYSPKQIPGAISYIDLLAHPTKGSASAAQAKHAMGIASAANFSFAGMDFARKNAYELEPKILCPNPIAMVALKRAAYLDDPMGRIKDLADIGELAWGLVEMGKHFEMGDLWSRVKTEPAAQDARKTLRQLGETEAVQWDLQNARQELLKRNFTGSDIDDLIPSRLIEWANYLPI